MSMRNWFREPDRRRAGGAEKPPMRVKIKPKGRAQVERRQLLAGIGGLCALALLLVVALTPAPTAGDFSPAAEADAGSSITLQRDCVLLQHMVFAPCGHEITRREALPQELAGKTRTELEGWYDLWRVTTFASDEVAMERTLDMYCPEHLVLMPDEGGLLCVWQNTYGDALSLRRELGVPVGDFPDDTQALLRAGLGFDTEEALLAWLENAES